MRQIVLTTWLLAVPAMAADYPWQGVWRGTIGNQMVMACLDGGSAGSYYYLQHLWRIPLDGLGQQPGVLFEGNRNEPTGVWKLGPPTGNSSSGEWAEPAGKRSLPIALTRLARSDELCSADRTYNAPRVAAHPVVPAKPDTFEARSLRRISTMSGKLSTFQITGDASKQQRINAVLRSRLQAKIGEYYECGKPDVGATYASHAKPIFWAGHVLVVREDFVCPPDRSEAYSYTTWDLEAADVVDLMSWFNETAFRNKNGYYEPTPALGRVLLAGWRATGRMCPDVRAGDSAATVLYSVRYPTARGISVTPSLASADRACEEPFAVPYSQLMPFLSDRGKAAVASIARERGLK